MRKSAVLVGVVAAVLVVAVVSLVGVAWGAWASSGSGQSTGQAGSALPPTTSPVSGSAVVDGLLFPAGTGTVVVTVNNPNPYPVRVVSVAAGPGSVSATGGIGTCDNTGVSLITSKSGAVLAAGTSATLTLPNAAAMSSDSDDGCQGATFTIPVTITVESA